MRAISIRKSPRAKTARRALARSRKNVRPPGSCDSEVRVHWARQLAQSGRDLMFSSGGSNKRWCPDWMAAFMVALAGAVVGLACIEALAQGTAFRASGRPVTIIVPYAAGGVTDTGARLMAAGLERELAPPVVVANKPGAASQVGLMELLRSKPDGYTLSYVVLPTVVTHYMVPGRDVTYSRSSSSRWRCTTTCPRRSRCAQTVATRRCTTW